MPATHAPRLSLTQRRDRAFFLAFLLVGVLGVVLGFVPPSWARFQGRADYPAPIQLQIHAGLFLAWVLLLAAQILLVRRGQVALHRRLGVLAVAMLPAMFVSSLFAETYGEQFYARHDPGSERFFIVPIYSLGLFMLFTGWGLLRRTVPADHKRLIYLGTAVLFGAAWSRVTSPLLAPLLGGNAPGMMIHHFLMNNLLLLALPLYDGWAGGRVRRVTAIGATMGLAGAAAVCWIFYAPWWLPVTRAIIVLFPGPA
ncbi:hypothetical protein [Sphingomonas sp. R1]|uniref:hypothetical protein n=1 Tax=Sphingomonas sp. R1 TaxID=399176 RepID=UPI002224DE81|nr:hypothetical protein [Sphingomonas sp. R1]UYY78987.1 hypothetical protein OIM94_08415 [Sphingomonas sp. R1]